MRGRKPRPVPIAPADLTILQQVARSESLPWYQVRRARIVLANPRGLHTLQRVARGAPLPWSRARRARIVLATARGLHNSTVAYQMQCEEATVWRTCRRYEREGLTGLLAPPDRPGRPGRISPPPASP